MKTEWARTTVRRPIQAVFQQTEKLRAGLSERGIELGEESAQGATAIVYRAYDRRHGRPVVVKVLRPETRVVLGSNRFLREIQIAAALQHPHIVPIYDSGTVDDTPFYVMPYIEGESLRERLAPTGRLALHETLRIARDVGDALAYAHAHGVVHRDIKPENILLEGDDALVSDFGIALERRPQSGDSGQESGRITATGVVVGTPAYMSPEQASADAAVDSRSDIFSLGCVVYEMLAGESPFPGTSAHAVIARRFEGPPIPLRERVPDVPATVSAAVEKALEREPAARFPRVEDFIAALEQPGRADPISELHGKGSRARASIFFGAGLVLTLVLLLAAWPRSRHQEPVFDPHRVAVASLSNETGDSTLSPLGPLVAAWITDRLARDGLAEVVTSATVVPAQHDGRASAGAWDDPGQLHDLAAETRAGTLVSGSYYRRADGAVEFHIEITDANSGELWRAIGPLELRPDSERIAPELSRAVAEAVHTLLAHRSQRSQA